MEIGQIIAGVAILRLSAHAGVVAVSLPSTPETAPFLSVISSKRIALVARKLESAIVPHTAMVCGAYYFIHPYRRTPRGLLDYTGNGYYNLLVDTFDASKGGLVSTRREFLAKDKKTAKEYAANRKHTLEKKWKKSGKDTVTNQCTNCDAKVSINPCGLFYQDDFRRMCPKG